MSIEIKNPYEDEETRSIENVINILSSTIERIKIEEIVPTYCRKYFNVMDEAYSITLDYFIKEDKNGTERLST